jgi:hypothetical protein
MGFGGDVFSIMTGRSWGGEIYTCVYWFMTHFFHWCIFSGFFTGLLRKGTVGRDFVTEVREGFRRLERGEDAENVEENPYGKYLLWFLRCVVGETYYKRNKASALLTSWSTPTDEAIALVLLENVWDQCCDIEIDKRIKQDEFARRNKDREERGVELLPEDKLAAACKWSCGGTGLKVRQGWTESGILYFNELSKRVSDFRRTESGKQFYAKWYRLIREESESKKRKRSAPEVAEKQVVAYCDWDCELIDVGDAGFQPDGDGEHGSDHSDSGGDDDEDDDDPDSRIIRRARYLTPM